MPPVELLSVHPVSSADCPCQTCGTGRNQDQMNVIGHEAPGQHLDRLPAALPTKCTEIDEPIFIISEDVLLIVPSMCDVMRQMWNDDARMAWH